MNKTAITEKNKYEHKVEEYNHLKDRFSKVKNIANSSVHKRLRRDEHYIKKQASHQLEELDREEEVSYKEYKYKYKELRAKRMKWRENRQNKQEANHRHLQQAGGGRGGGGTQPPTSKAARR